ncbi:class I SAM-dependent methyltransferase [Knoellia sp. Soil729]|uniref:class I SAM-dependent methyltransferase n=1 Tax=Knoellia sp. Soil729 TaxID=1736394 RepID=UPI0006FC01C8|nr:class I SAM-dependent methyltransferase [Knoellia sp. Soil729]KRE41310.1 SAM-dependent methyltransferase [Knoellia sp. Soil729]
MSQQRGLGRSVHLFRSFLVEQTEPDRFYGDLAEDSVDTVADHMSLDGRIVLDVGAGPHQFADTFRARGARYVAIDHDPTVSSVADGGLTGSALALPVADGAADVVFSSNLLEHVPHFAPVADELLRVTRPGGVLYLSYTNWWSPWGAHEASPWHWLGAGYAARRYERRHGHPPKNRLGESLYRVSVAEGLAWARNRQDVDILGARPRYLPDAARHVLAVPGLRELVTWNLLLILRRRDDSLTTAPATGGTR